MTEILKNAEALTGKKGNSFNRILIIRLIRILKVHRQTICRLTRKYYLSAITVSDYNPPVNR